VSKQVGTRFARPTPAPHKAVAGVAPTKPISHFLPTQKAPLDKCLRGLNCKTYSTKDFSPKNKKTGNRQSKQKKPIKLNYLYNNLFVTTNKVY
jgi:hypothetical protein